MSRWSHAKRNRIGLVTGHYYDIRCENRLRASQRYWPLQSEYGEAERAKMRKQIRPDGGEEMLAGSSKCIETKQKMEKEEQGGKTVVMTANT